MNNFANFGQYFASIQQTMGTLSAKLANLENDVAKIAANLESALSVCKEPSSEHQQLTVNNEDLEKRIKRVEESLSELDSIFSQLPSSSSTASGSAKVEMNLNGSTLDIDNSSSPPFEETNTKKKIMKKK